MYKQRSYYITIEGDSTFMDQLKMRASEGTVQHLRVSLVEVEPLLPCSGHQPLLQHLFTAVVRQLEQKNTNVNICFVKHMFEQI